MEGERANEPSEEMSEKDIDAQLELVKKGELIVDTFDEVKHVTLPTTIHGIKIPELVRPEDVKDNNPLLSFKLYGGTKPGASVYLISIIWPTGKTYEGQYPSGRRRYFNLWKGYEFHGRISDEGIIPDDQWELVNKGLEEFDVREKKGEIKRFGKL